MDACKICMICRRLHWSATMLTSLCRVPADILCIWPCRFPCTASIVGVVTSALMVLTTIVLYVLPLIHLNHKQCTYFGQCSWLWKSWHSNMKMSLATLYWSYNLCIESFIYSQSMMGISIQGTRDLLVTSFYLQPKPLQLANIILLVCLQWLNNCIGRKNYKTFVALMTTSLMLVSTESAHLSMCLSEVHFLHLTLFWHHLVWFCSSLWNGLWEEQYLFAVLWISKV